MDEEEDHHPRFVVGIHQSDAATRAHQLFLDGEFQPMASLELRTLQPRPGWLEHDAAQLLADLRQCLDYAQGADAVALAHQGDAVMAWNGATGEPLCNAIAGMDLRARAHGAALSAEGAGALVTGRAGLPLDPGLPALKLRWILDHVPEAGLLARDGRLRLGTVDAFFLDRLCGSYASDPTTASRTGLMNLDTGQWDTELCRLFGVPAELLPPIVATVHEHGTIRGTRLPLTASVAQPQAALMGHGCHAPGESCMSFGASAFSLVVAGEAPVCTGEPGVLPTVAWKLGARTAYALEARVLTAGSALEWARSLGLFSSVHELRAIGGTSALERGLVFVPALSGLASPYGDRDAAGLWLGMGPDTRAADLLQAVLEGVALCAAEALDALRRGARLQGCVRVDGALTLVPYFREFLCRALGRCVTVASTADLTGLGCAQFAFVGAGHGPLETLPPLPPPDHVLQPDEPLPPRSRARFATAVERARGWRAL